MWFLKPVDKEIGVTSKDGDVTVKPLTEDAISGDDSTVLIIEDSLGRRVGMIHIDDEGAVTATRLQKS